MSSPRTRTTHQPDPSVNRYPDLAEKQEFPQSNITTLRKREPTNEFIANKGPSMVFDHRNQMPIVPTMVATGAGERSVQTTTNKSGKPYALDTFIGGSPDTQRDPLAKPPIQRMTE